MKVVLLASKRMVLGFLLGGIHEGYVCEDGEEAGKQLEKCKKDADVGIILVSQAVADMIPEKIHAAKTSSRMIPVVSVIPDETKHPEMRGAVQS